MSKSNDTQTGTAQNDEEENEWHGLSGMIGEAINVRDYGVNMWGGYLVDRAESGDIRIYRVTEDAETEGELPDSADIVTQIGERHYAGRICGSLEAPADGWESETHMLPESIFAGYE